MSSRQPSANYMKFVHSMATKILDPSMKVAPVPKMPKTVRISKNSKNSKNSKT